MVRLQGESEIGCRNILHMKPPVPSRRVVPSFADSNYLRFRLSNWQMIMKVAIALSFLSLLATIARAEEVQIQPKGWTSLEQHAWTSIQAGEPVDFRKTSPDSKSLRAQFLIDILTNPSLVARIPALGISIAGAHIWGSLVLNGIPAVPSLTFTDCHFGSIKFGFCKCSEVRFSSSSFESLVCDHTTFDGLDVKDLKISGLSPLIQFINCVIDEFFGISGTDSKEVIMRFLRTHFATPVYIAIPANYSMEDVVFENTVSLSGPGHFLEALQLHAASFTCAVNAAEMKFTGAIADRLEITTNVSEIRELNLSGTVLRELVLPDIDKLHGWDPSARLILTDAKIDIVSDYRTSWPKRVQLEGFAYGKWRPKDKDQQTVISRWNTKDGTKNWF